MRRTTGRGAAALAARTSAVGPRRTGGAKKLDEAVDGPRGELDVDPPLEAGAGLAVRPEALARGRRWPAG